MNSIYPALLAFFIALPAFATGGTTCTTRSGISISVPQGHVVGSPIPGGSSVTVTDRAGATLLSVPENRVVNYWVERSFLWLRGVDAQALEPVLLARINGIYDRYDGKTVGYMSLTAKLADGRILRVGTNSFPTRVICVRE